MPGFNKNLDKELFSEATDFEKTKITVSVFAYNNGAPKLQIVRQNKSASGELMFAKLGRMSASEVEAILPLVKKAKVHLQ